MPVMVYSISKDGLKDETASYGLSDTKGWWNVIKTADIDNDGDKDIVAGNLGFNIKHKASATQPFKLYVDDFDKNGTNDVYLGFYEGENLYPVRGKQCSSEQMPFVKNKFKTYEDFGYATITDVLEGRIGENTVIKEAQSFATSVFLNDGGKMIQKELPNETQISPVYGIAIDDFDKDGKLDIFMAGNMYDREVETTRSDAGKGCFVKMNEKGEFEVNRTLYTGISADKDVRDVLVLKSDNSSILLIGNNDDALQIYTY